MKRRNTPTPRNISSWIGRLFALVALTLPAPLTAATLSFQNGVSPSGSYIGTEDTYIRSTSPTSNFNSENRLRADGNPDTASLIRWDISAIPSSAIVTGATITFNVSNTSSQPYNVYEMIRPWVASQATWNVYANGNAWQMVGASGTLDRGSTVLGTITAATSGIQTFALNAAGIVLVQKWVNNGATNRGIIIQNYANTASFSLHSSATSAAINRPKLTLTYTIAPPPPPSSQYDFQNGISPTPSYLGTKDTYIKASSPSSNYDTDIQLRADGTPTSLSSLIQWDISVIPPSAVVTSAAITVAVTNTSSQTYNIYEIKRPWVASQATWNVYAAGQGWQIAGASGALDRGSTVLGAITAPTSGIQTFLLNGSGIALVQSWVNNGTTNRGMIIQNYANTNGLTFDSSATSTAANRPKLTVTYISIPVATQLAFTTAPQTTTAGAATGPITVQLRDALGGPVNAGAGGQAVHVTSNSTGIVTFTPPSPLTIPAGASTVSFTYTDTRVGTPLITASDASPPNGATGLADTTQTVTINPGPTTVTGYSVSGTVFSDANRNGAFDLAESGIPSVSVALFSMASGTTTAATTTDARGTYLLNGIKNGSYEIRETPPAGYILTTPAVISITVNNAPVPNQHFGNFAGVKITGLVFNDTGTGGGIPNNGVQEGAEAGIVGVSVKITDMAASTTYDQTVTGAGGAYTLWVATAAGMTVIVRETNPANYISTTPDTITLTIAPGDNISNNRFGDVPPLLFTPHGSQTMPPGGVALYVHTVTAGTTGQIALSTATTAGLLWTFYKDTNGNGQLDGGEPVLTSADLNMTAGQVLMFISRAQIPTGIPLGTVDVTTLTAVQTLLNSALTATAMVTDTTTIAPGDLKLTKAGSVTVAKPGNTIDYTLTYQNIGTETLTGIVIYDYLSEYFLFVSAVPLPDAGFPDASGLLRWTLPGTVVSGASGSVGYTVLVK